MESTRYHPTTNEDVAQPTEQEQATTRHATKGDNATRHDRAAGAGRGQKTRTNTTQQNAKDAKEHKSPKRLDMIVTTWCGHTTTRQTS